MEQEAMAGPNQRRRRSQSARRVALALAALLAFCGLQVSAAAGATTPTDLGEGLPLSVNGSDHVLLGRLVAGEEEEEIAGPWAIWASGEKTILEPLNGGPETSEATLGSIEHQLFLYRLNEAGDAGGTSTISYFDEEGEEHTVHRAAWYSPSGVGHEVPPLVETVLNSEGKPHVVGALGVGIDEAGDVAGFGVVQEAEHLFSRGFLSAGGSTQPSEVAASGAPWTEVFAINEAGELFGETAEVNSEYEPINPKYVVWKTASANPTVLDFNEALSALPLANDGSVLGGRSGKAYLHTPDGTETEVSGMKPFSVNSSHVVIGSKSVGGVEHAATWQEGTVTDLNSELPEGSGWVLRRATAINDDGDIAGIGTYEGHQVAFLLQGPGLHSSISGAPSVALPEEGTTDESFTVTLAQASDTAVTVGYETEDGTATVAHEDYEATSGTLTFAPGETSETIEVPIDSGDGEDSEATETYTVRLQATATTRPAAGAATARGTVGLPGIAGELVSGPVSGAAKPLTPAAGITLQITGKTTAGVEVHQSVTSKADGTYTGSVDPGTYSVTPSGVPVGQPTGFTWSPGAHCPGKRKEATCEKVMVKAANGKVVQSTVDFGYGQRDPQVENIEVLQGAQLKTWDKQGPEISVPEIKSKMTSFEYSGVGLAGASDTLARVYIGNNGAGSAQEVTAQLRGYSEGAGGLTPLPGSPLSPVDGPVDALPEPAVEGERTDAGATLNFRLPASWAKGKILLAATVDPKEEFPECSGCRADDNRALTGIEFTEVPPLKFTPESLEWKEGTRTVAPSNTIAAVTRTWPYWPLPTGGLQATGEPVHVDLSEALAAVAKQLKMKRPANHQALGYNEASLIGCLSWNARVKLNEGCINLLEPRLFAAEKAALPATAGTATVVGVYNNSGLRYGVQGAANAIPGQFSYVPESAGNSEVVVHEMLHQLGFKHSGCTGPNDEEPWPANALGQGSLVGFGEDRSLESVGGIGPILSTSGREVGQGTHDIMSYCFPTWPSSFNWERALQKLAKGSEPQPFTTYPAFSSLTATTASARAAAAASLVTVQAVNVKGVETIADITPGAGGVAGGATGQKSSYSFQALNAKGHVIARAPALVVGAHADVLAAKPQPDDEITFLQAEIPAADAASLELAQGKHVVSSEPLPRGKLELTLRRVKPAECRRAGALKLHFKAKPGEGLFSSVRVRAAVGRRLETIEVGARHGVILLPARSRPKGASKLMVEYSDGVASASRSVKLPKGCRAG